MPQLLGTTKNQCRVSHKGSLLKLREIANGLSCWAIYRDYVNGKPFHNATDETFLIEHNDPFFNKKK